MDGGGSGQFVVAFYGRNPCPAFDFYKLMMMNQKAGNEPGNAYVYKEYHDGLLFTSCLAMSVMSFPCLHNTTAGTNSTLIYLN